MVRGKRWTLISFVDRATEIHGENFDYSEITEEMVLGRKSKVPVICNSCQWHWTPSITSHINDRKGCPNCSGQVKITYTIFLERAKTCHGDRFDYSKIQESMVDNGSRSRVPVTCRTCNYSWFPLIADHMRAKENGCPNCSGRARITYDRFVSKVFEIHGQKLNLELVQPQDIQTTSSKIKLLCSVTTCEYFTVPWETTIRNMMRVKTACPGCANHEVLTGEKILSRLIKMHGEEKFDYSQVNWELVKGGKYILSIVCKTCNYQFLRSAHTQLQGQGCPLCQGHVRWTYERFMDIASTLHPTMDYSEVLPTMEFGVHAFLPVRCCVCEHRWCVELSAHINRKSRCPKCTDRLKFTLPLFLEKAVARYGTQYNYSLTTPDMVQNSESFIEIICNTCQCRWIVRLRNHLHEGTGCPACTMSQGERACKCYLDDHSIPFTPSFKILNDNGKRRFFDFQFRIGDVSIIAEVDGAQHFEKNGFWKMSGDNQKIRDIEKSLLAIRNGHKLIRIDYRNFKNMRQQLGIAIQRLTTTSDQYYVSSPFLYTHITDAINPSVQ